MKAKLLLFLMVFSSLFICFSCKKSNTSTDNDTSHLLINNTAEVLSNDVFKTVLYAWMEMEDSLYHPNDTSNFHTNESCMELSLTPFDTTTTPKTLTISFPNSSCSCNDGLQRSGTISVQVSGLLSKVDSYFRATFNNFMIDSKPITGNKNLSIIYSKSGKDIVFYDTSNISIQYRTDPYQWYATHVVDWALGTATHTYIYDDVFYYNGKSSTAPVIGITSGVGSFNSNIIQSLIFSNSCFWLHSGAVEVMPSNLPIRTVHYSDTCMQHATYEVNNETFDVNF